MFALCKNCVVELVKKYLTHNWACVHTNWLNYSYSMSKFQFTQQVNPVSGKMEWVAQDQDEYDYLRDVARSSYADMLHDTERNQMYNKAIQLAVQKMHDQGKKAKVLDIGTGTGLLSMMAAKAGADSITAIEVFEPMANVAKLVTKANGFGDIKVINKHSMDVTIGEGENLKEKANILVTELFDTELIGEGALKAYQHAHANLMEENCIAVPHSATTYVQVVESDLMHSWHSLNPIKIDKKNNSSNNIQPDPKMLECPGVPAVHDIQLSQVKRTQFTELTDAIEVFNFEWGSDTLSSASRKRTIQTRAIATGKAQVVLSWWTLSMDQKGEITLSTAPYWKHPDPNHMQWRDHWMQSVYFLPNAFDISLNDSICITALHDAYSMWFEAKAKHSDLPKTSTTRPVCDYLPRMLWSRPRLGMLNDDQRNQAYVNALNKVSQKHGNDFLALCISDVSLLPLIAAKTCCPKGEVFSLENDTIGQRGIQNIVKHNKLSNVITIINGLQGEDDCIFKNNSIKLLVGEPFFNASYLPWHNLRFWYARTEFDSKLAQDAQIMPCRAHLNISAVQFEDLWKIRSPVGTVEGFDVSIMDEMITHAMEMEDYNEPEPHALWEYPCRMLSTPTSPISFNLTKPVPSEEVISVGYVHLDKQSNKESVCHAVVLWMVYDLDDEISISDGLIDQNEMFAKWNMHHKQAVFFLRRPIILNQSNANKMEYEITFIPKSGEMKMKFKVV